MADQHGPLYRNIEFCRNAETLWHKLQSGHWDWLGVHPKGQFVLGSPRSGGGMPDGVTMKMTRGSANESQHGVKHQVWVGMTDVDPSSEWFEEEAEAKVRYEELLEQYRSQPVVLARVWRIEGGFPAEEEFIARTPPPNYR